MLAVVLVVAAAVASACGGGAAADDAGPEFAAHGAWARPAGAGEATAAYLVLVNRRGTPVVVAGASSSDAASVTLHETATTGHGAAAMAHMRPLARVAVPAGDSVVFAPAGRHLMLGGLRRALAAGDRVRVALRTAAGEEVTAEVEVRAP